MTRTFHGPRLVWPALIALIAGVAAGLSAGCHGGSADAGPGPADHGSSGATASSTTQPAAPVILRPVQRPTSHAPVVHLDVYRMAVPMGAVSRSEEFWKRVDEQQIDPATYDLLLKNGVRVGIAPIGEWADYFKDIFERNNARVVMGSVLSHGSGTVEMPIKQDVKSQDIFYFNDRGELSGKTYLKCEDVLGVSFTPDPRKPGALKLTITPTVRNTYTHWEVTLRNEERAVEFKRPEYLYDLNLRATIPPDTFLVMAPSPQSTWPESLGNAFLTTAGEAEHKEQVLVFVPRTVRPGDPASANPPPAKVGAAGQTTTP